MLEKLATLYRAADAFVVVTGEYNHGLPPALANVLDHFLEEYSSDRRLSCRTWADSSAACAPPCTCRRCSASSACQASRARFPFRALVSAFDPDGNELTPGAGRRFDRFASELEWYAEALKRQREEKGVPY